MKKKKHDANKIVDEMFNTNFKRYKPANLAPLIPDGALTNPPERRWTYSNINKITKLIVGLQGELERQLIGQDSAFYGKYLSIRNSVMSLFGKQNLNPDQILEIQLAGAKDLNEAMTELSEYASHGLDILTDYNRKLAACVPENLKSGYHQKKEATMLIKLRDELRREIDGLTINHPDYIPIKLRLSFLKQEIDRTGKAYNASQRNIDHYLQTTQQFEQLGKILSSSLTFSEDMKDRTDKFIDDIIHTRHIPGIIGAFGNVSYAMEKSVDVLSDHVQKLYSRMRPQVNRITNSFDSLKSGKYFDRLGYDINDYFAEMKSITDTLESKFR